MKFGIVIFPGSNCDEDVRYVLASTLGEETVMLWHKERDLHGADCIVLPGGFSYGDYLRAGAMAACSPIMESVRQHAKKGGLVMGICNGFQILQQAQLLPGALMHNRSLLFLCRDVHVRVEHTKSPYTQTCRQGEVLRMPIAHLEGSFFVERRAYDKLLAKGQILFRYCDRDGKSDDESNPNGSFEAVAGVSNEAGNVMGFMPHPERAAEELLGNRDGLKVFQSVVASWKGLA